MEGQIRLRWTSHQGTILSVFDALLSSDTLVDVTLACEGNYLRAHKVILSACSPYFQELLNLDTNKHPIFFLKDVKYTELKALIQYMYRGEVNIAQEDLASLLEVAQALQIRGLAEVETTNSSNSSDAIIPPGPGLLTKKAKGLSKTSPPPATLSVASTSTHATRSFPQAHSYPTTVLVSGMNTSTSSSAPPPNKKSRTETRLSTQSVQVPKQVQLVDPLSNLPPQPTISLQRYDQLHPSNATTSSAYVSAGRTDDDDTDYGLEEMLEQPEVYETERVKVETVTGDIGEDPKDEGENSLSQSDFPDAWNPGDGDNLGMAEDDGEGEFQSGSGANEAGSQGNVEGDILSQKSFRLPPVFDGRFFEVISAMKVGNQRRGTRVKARCKTCRKMFESNGSSNFILHLKRHHPEEYQLFIQKID